MPNIGLVIGVTVIGAFFGFIAGSIAGYAYLDFSGTMSSFEPGFAGAVLGIGWKVAIVGALVAAAYSVMAARKGTLASTVAKGRQTDGSLPPPPDTTTRL